MIIVFLAGGIGERMKKTGQFNTKDSASIGSKPVINYLIDGFDPGSGNIDKIYILTRTAQETAEGITKRNNPRTWMRRKHLYQKRHAGIVRFL